MASFTVRYNLFCSAFVAHEARFQWLMIDLHTHTTFSDGTSSPEALLQEACVAGLQALAITDHDTLAGYETLAHSVREPGMELICGIELSTQFRSTGSDRATPVHLLGYFLDELPPAHFKDWLKTISSTRRQRNLDLMTHLQARGLDLDWPDLPLPPETLSRPYFARALVAKGYVPDIQAAFARYLSDRQLDGIERKLPSLGEAIEKVRGAGGLPSLAHPIRLPLDEPALRSLVEEMAGCGLQALEVHYSDHTSEETNRLLKLAGDFRLLATGGSDYHGQNKPHIMLGKGRGDLCLPYTLLEAMKQFVHSRRSPLP